MKPMIVEDFLNLIRGLKAIRCETTAEGHHLDYATALR